MRPVDLASLGLRIKPTGGRKCPGASSLDAVGIGELLQRAAERNGKTKADLARATGIDAGTVGYIFKGTVDNPEWKTIEKLVAAIGTTWGDLFEEVRLPLSEDDAVVAAEFREVLNRLLANAAAEHELTGRKGAPPKTRKPRKTKSFDEIREPAELKDGVPEVEYLPHHHIPGEYLFSGAHRAYRVLTDAMVRAKIGENSIIFTGNLTQDLDAADGKIAVVDVNGTQLIKRVARHDKETWLISEHPRYNAIRLVYRRSIRSVAIVVNAR